MDGFIFAMITDFITQMFALKHPFSELFTHFQTEALAIKGTSVQRIGSLTERGILKKSSDAPLPSGC